MNDDWVRLHRAEQSRPRYSESPAPAGFFVPCGAAILVAAVAQTQYIPVAVIGAGQAGLAAGYYLTQKSVDFAIFDEGHQIGHSWRDRWDSLRLFTPARYSCLPGLPFPGHPWRYPTKDETADYLQRYAEDLGLPIRQSTRVTGLSSVNGCYEIRSQNGGTYQADAVIIATGGFNEPVVPPFARELADGVFQVHSSRYRRPDQLIDGPALVVGAANSGIQIAGELSAGREVELSVGSRLPPLPRRLVGKDVFWWLDRLQLLRMPHGQRWAAKGGRSDFLVGESIRRLLRDNHVTPRGRVTGAGDRTVTFADGASSEVSNVVWATGFRPRFDWLDVPVLSDGAPVHRAGVTAVPGLYFLGLDRQRRAGSALIGWVRHDAKFIVEHATRWLGARRSRSAAGPKPAR